MRSLSNISGIPYTIAVIAGKLHLGKFPGTFLFSYILY